MSPRHFLQEYATLSLGKMILQLFLTEDGYSLREMLYATYTENALVEFAQQLGAEPYLPTEEMKVDLPISADTALKAINGSRAMSYAWGCANKLLSPEVMKEKLLTFEIWQIDTFLKAIDGMLKEKPYTPADDNEYDDLLSFNEWDYSFSSRDEKSFLIPHDVIEAFLEIYKGDFIELHAQYRWLINCLDIVSYFYGSIPIRHFYTLYSTQGSLSQSEMVTAIERLDKREHDCVVKKQRIIARSWLHDDEYRKLERVQADKPYYFPSYTEVEEILHYGFPIHQKETRDLLRLLKSAFKMGHPDAMDLVEEIWYRICQEYSLHDIMDYLQKKKIMFSSEKIMQKFMNTLMDLSNRTPHLYNRGGTPESLRPMLADGIRRNGMTIIPGSTPAAKILAQAQDQLRSIGVRVDLNSNAVESPGALLPGTSTGSAFQPPKKKIYPNEPCPCGSGKKYKNCNGRIRS